MKENQEDYCIKVYKILLRKIKEDLNKEWDIPWRRRES